MKTTQPFDAGPRFEVQRRLGAGGMGVVYEAYDRERNELVALKTLRRTDGRWLTQFKREFRAIHDLAHPNLVAFNELFDGESEPFFTMELVHGADLLRFVRGQEGEGGDSGPVSPLAETMAGPGGANPLAETMAGPAAIARSSVVAAACAPATASDEGSDTRLAGPRAAEAIAYDEARLRAALKQLAVGIAVLHAAGKVHRDIKPSNIMVTTAGRVVLLDFGLLSDAVEAQVSSEGRVAGTVDYMAPEQALAGDVSPAADWYSVGVVLFQALTGSLPHTGRTPYEVILRKQKYMAAPPRQFVATVPPDLDALCTELLQREPRDRPTAGEIFDRLGIDDQDGLLRHAVTAAGTVTALTPFVGRARELAALRAAYDRVSASPLICLVEGISGVGKSQLVERFLEALREAEPDTVVLSGRCYEREVVSYKAFDGIVDALARYLARLSPVEVAQLMPRRATLLARMFPVLKRVEAIAMAPEAPDLPDPHDQRLRMFSALRELFLRLARRRRLVWYIDDLQWSDADSLVLLQDLFAQEAGLPVLLVATMRPVDDDARAGLLARLDELAPLERHQLGELAPDESRELAGLLMPGRDASTLAAVAADAGGHPLLLQELARHAGAGPGAPTGASLDEMLTTRIEQLGGNARRLLQAISVSGGPLTQEVAAIAVELSHAEQVKAARVLRAANLARTDGVHRNNRIVVYHDRVREHVTAALDDAPLRHVHKRLALALEQTGAAEHSPRALVRHARAAGRHALAAGYALTAAEHAVSSLAFDQAAELYAVAIDLGSHDEPKLRSLRIDLATALVNAGRGAEAADALLAAAEHADATTGMECRLRAAEQLLSCGHIDRGVDVVSDLLAEIGTSLPATPKRALLHLLWGRVKLRLRGLKWKERHEREISDAELTRLDVFKAVGVGLNMVDTIRGADFQARHLRLALRLGEPQRVGRALAHEACYLSTQGGRARKRALVLIAESERIHQAHPDPYLEAWVFTASALVKYMGGGFPAAYEQFSQAEKVFFEQTVGKTWELNTVRLFRLFTLRHLGEIGKLRGLSNKYMRDARRRGDLLTETSMRRVRNIAWLAEGRPDHALADLERAAWTPPRGTYHLQHYYELESRIELALFEDRAPPAIKEYAPDFALLSSSLLVRIQIVRAISTWLRGRLALAAAEAGHDQGANLALAKRCAARIAGEDATYGAVWSSLLAGGIAVQAGDDDRAQTLLARAAEAAREQDMTHCLAAAHYRRGELLGGEEGARLVDQAEKWMAERGVSASERRVQIIAPGFTRG